MPGTRAARRWLNVGEWVVRGLGGDEVTELSLASPDRAARPARRRRRCADALAWTRHARRTCSPSRIAGRDARRAAPATPLRRRRAARSSPSPATTTSPPASAPGSWPRATSSTRAARPRRSSASSRRRSTPTRSSASSPCGPSVGWHVAEGRHAILDGLWSGLAYREVLDALGIADEDRPELDAGALATAPGDAPALDLDFRALDARRVRLPADVAPERVWRATLDAAAAMVDAQLARVDEVAGPRRRLVVTGGWARDEAVLAAKARLGPLETPPVVEAGCRGAALLAGVAAGLFESADALPPIPAPAGRTA